jgi:YHS domain-containing protein
MTNKLIVGISLAMALAAPCMASTQTVKAKHPIKTAVMVCPVTGAKIASIKDAAGHSTYKGKTYYFCCPGCKPMFDADPAKYAH